ncbi:hypothetical protein PBN151_1389 [Paenibacillus sp. NAIST15-1]|nr:hypothetical protein PBN151_1389 [Paenibacillus sp. NAIST15-1]
MNDIERVMRKICETQDDSWNGECSCLDCYWNMNHPTKRPDDKQCVSEDLADTRMIPNTVECPSYWSFTFACGVSKEGDSNDA